MFQTFHFLHRCLGLGPSMVSTSSWAQPRGLPLLSSMQSSKGTLLLNIVLKSHFLSLLLGLQDRNLAAEMMPHCTCLWPSLTFKVTLALKRLGRLIMHETSAANIEVCKSLRKSQDKSQSWVTDGDPGHWIWKVPLSFHYRQDCVGYPSTLEGTLEAHLMTIWLLKTDLPHVNHHWMNSEEQNTGIWINQERMSQNPIRSIF